MTPTWSEYNHSHLRVSSNIGVNYKFPKSKFKNWNSVWNTNI